MTIKLLTPRGIIPINAIITLDAATEAALVADKVATTDLTGGTVWAGPVDRASAPAKQAWAEASLVSGAGNPVGLPTAIFGDSHTAVYGSNAMVSVSNHGHLFAMLGQPFRVTHEGGIIGQTGSQILARVQSRVTTPGEFKVAFIDLGTNDIVLRSTLYASDVPTTIAAIKSYYQQSIDHLKARVQYVFAIGMVPFQAAYGLTASEKTIAVRVNAWLEKYCRQVGACYLDKFSACVDTDGLTGAVTRMKDDFHPGNNGAFAFARLNYQRAARYLGLPTGWDGVCTQGDFDNDTAGALQLLRNPLMLASGGTLSNGATGTCPANTRIRAFQAGTSACAVSVVASKTGPGFGLKMALTGLANNDNWAFAWEQASHFVDPVGGVYFLKPGSTFYYEYILTTNNAAGVLKTVTSFVRVVVTGGASAGTIDYPVNGYASATDDVLDADFVAHHFRSPEIVVPSDATSVQITAFYIQAIALAGACDVTVERPGIVRRI